MEYTGVLKVYDPLKYPFTHPNVYTDANGRAIRATTRAGFLVFGQYEKGFQGTDLAAVFSIMIDNNTFDDAPVCVLDVVENASRVIAKLAMTRKDFPAAGKHVRFAVPFKPTSPDTVLEFRLYYIGYTYMAVKTISVIDQALIKVEDLPSDNDLLGILLPPPPGGTYVYNLKINGTSLLNGSQILTITGWSTYMWKDMKTYPWNPYKGMSVSDYANLLVKYNANLTRTFCIDTWTSSLFPWKKVGSKFDLNQFDPTYMANLRNLVNTFGRKGIIVHLDLFDNVALWDHGDGMTWTRHPFNAINGGPISNPRDGRPEFYNPNSTVKALQEKYIRYMVSSLKDLKNVIFEVCNEYNGGGGAGWHNWVADVINSENSSVLISASTDINVSIADQLFKHRNIYITTSHANEWITGDLKSVNQGVLNRLKGYGKPTILSTDGSKENYASMKNDMYNAAKTATSQGFGIEFKELYEAAAQMIAPLGVPIKPTIQPDTKPDPGTGTQPPISDFCKGGELICIDGFDQAKIESMGIKNWGGSFSNGTYIPANRGGLEFKLNLDISRSYVIEMDIEGNIAFVDKLEDAGGKANLLGAVESGGPFWISFQRREADYRGGGRFRFTLSIRGETGSAMVITTPELSGEYSTKNWGNEPHKLKVEVTGNRCRLLIDQNYVSKWAQATSPAAGIKSLTLLLGNSTDRFDKQHAVTQFRRFKISYTDQRVASRPG